ncbi:aspartate kinase [Aliikangiella sp. G2MR2-5]|uniref:aspartate kinase n=1 Tax=Aliikangiella sp. G2MR2-5 TaxID=2788943 RepID=UPI0018AB4C3E|nr:aspartate kinase [Aliikangiella sp. G2MR2-5]
MASLIGCRFENQVSEQQKVAVHKFGGSSLASAKRLNNVVNIIEKYSSNDDYIVVSANGDITDFLVELSEGGKQALQAIKTYYQPLIEDTLTQPEETLGLFEKDLVDLQSQNKTQDEILSYGEVWSARLLVALLKERHISAQFIDARELFITGSIDDFKSFDVSYFNSGLTRNTYGNYGKRKIITGYIAKNIAGKTITLGRNGSDYSASLVARFGQAESVNLWTDVKGIYSADPRLVDKAFPIKHLSYEEANSLASVGTNVLHQKAIAPLVDRNIPLFVRSSLAPDSSCTRVSLFSETEFSIKSAALKTNLSTIVFDFEEKVLLDWIIHSLFEKHVVVLNCEVEQRETIADARQRASLLIDTCHLQQALDCFSSHGSISKKLDISVLKEECSVIALVGYKASENNQLTQKILSGIQEKSQLKFLNNRDEHSIYLATNSPTPEVLLEKIFAICFQPQLTFDRTASTVYSNNRTYNKQDELTGSQVEAII